MRDEEVPPSVNLLESMRSVGYSLEAALADLIDNSITAHATLVEIDGDVVGGSYLAVLDDGIGMAPLVAREALRLAGTSGDRDVADLGRFGLGLKTASLSQARCVTVLTRAEGVTTALQWDIDHVVSSGSWVLRVLSDADMSEVPLWGALDARNSGTLVVWTHLDLLLGDATSRGDYLREKLVYASHSLSLVFHRYLHRGTGGIQIRVNGKSLVPLDPFLEKNTRTQMTPTDVISFGGQDVEVTAFTLPHPSGLSATERNRPDLSTGMRDSQGFYIYRNRRLISHGGWYGLAAKSELTKQTRVRVDLPNTLDRLWQLDIKKSRAEPPATFKSYLKRVIDPVLERGRRVHTYRGRKATDAHVTRVWDRVVDRDGHVAYRINGEHPVLVVLREQLPPEQVGALDSALEMLASSYPAQDLYAVMAGGSIAADSPLDDAPLLAKLRLLHEAGALGTSVSEATAQLVNIEPFNRADDLRALVEGVMNGDMHGAQ